jgi:DNA-binding beta-propeller fold protein YncE
VYVADFWNNRVEKFTSSGTFIKQWGSYGAGPSQFNNPAGVAVDSSGNVYVTDYGNNRVEKFDSSGTYITQCGSKGSGNGQFGDYGPNSVAVDSSGNVYATDWNNYRVEKFGSVTTIPVDQAMLFIAIAIIVGSVGVYLTMRKRPRNLQRMKE